MNAYATASLYVGDLHPEVTEALLFELFHAVGPVASIRVCRDSVSRGSLGYAYVNFHSVVDAERALETMNYTLIKSKPCRIMWCHRDPSLRKSGTGNVFIKNLDKSIDNKALYDTFSAFGNILSCKVATDDNGASKGYGFVHYETQEAASMAVTRVNGMLMNGKKVFVGFFVSRKERQAGEGGDDVFTNVFTKNVPVDWDDEQLKEFFAQCGTIKSAIVMKSADGKPRGFGFVNYAEHTEAERAIEELHNKEVNGKVVHVGRAQKKRERERELREKYEKLKQERASKFTGVNLYVKNLADDVNDEKLREAFAKFGNISSAKVMVDDKGATRGFGFVHFGETDEATKAVSEMNGQILGNKPLYVALAQRKEERKNMLEQQHSQRVSAGVRMQGNGPERGAQQPGVYPGGPFFYSPQQMPPQPQGGRGFMYPQQLMMPRGPGVYQPMGQMANYGAIAMGNRGGGGGRGQQHQGGRGPQGGGPQGGPGMRGPAGGKQGGIQQRTAYQQGGRPQQGGGAAGGQGGPGQQPRKAMGGAPGPHPGMPMPMPAQGAPPAPMGQRQEINAATLAAAPPEQQKQLLGERLFPLIQNVEPHLAGKITGMLLEMDNGELLNLLESPDALNAKIMEALSVLQMHADAQPSVGEQAVDQVVN
uniref:Polyadenylate-binding protein n=1 Tax=Coccolithus braarudii TaxID=221442 RepID=A0A7S0LBS7_9EUKA|mmetsp:Transcript_31870/g.68520  ORF Transcript_31870/g.68520 Transcript_31870/m.68520 type:complete len:649 (+) Transcript_31870:66-2012(+)|eukprot:CAMPEP_0183352640 /NCGR_PEP_ID=MMETSP0164_2-20130417/29558_1 /TAXON_ID=221442 /ORGANISM="Coccolithus pelagicus ssp braarudi, Strain PLY182g" /LENGTH=648 /DNA_ID=CAMNT_0025525121 /DNA_START=61 /DNA_END=2007 /DNA_ORIENTATION=+